MEPRCRFCNAKVIARFALSAGCFVYPDDREQFLCAHHVVKATPIEGFLLVEVLWRDGWDWMVGNGSVRRSA